MTAPKPVGRDAAIIAAAEEWYAAQAAKDHVEARAALARLNRAVASKPDQYASFYQQGTP